MLACQTYIERPEKVLGLHSETNNKTLDQKQRSDFGASDSDEE
jgi:hypothetical protein